MFRDFRSCYKKRHVGGGIQHTSSHLTRSETPESVFVLRHYLGVPRERYYSSERFCDLSRDLLRSHSTILVEVLVLYVSLTSILVLSFPQTRSIFEFSLFRLVNKIQFLLDRLQVQVSYRYSFRPRLCLVNRDSEGSTHWNRFNDSKRHGVERVTPRLVIR